jgi:hypothetical protein
VQSPQTTIWRPQDILLPALATAKAQRVDTYTTRLQVTDENRRPLPGAEVQLAAEERASLSISNRYYVITPDPIPVAADQTGALVIVEPVSNLQATKLIVHGGDGTTITINPMDKPMNKVAALTTADDLSAATITYQNGSVKPLVDPSTGPDDKRARWRRSAAWSAPISRCRSRPQRRRRGRPRAPSESHRPEASCRCTSEATHWWPRRCRCRALDSPT